MKQAFCLKKPEQIAVVTCAAPIATSFEDLESKNNTKRYFTSNS